MLIRFAPPPVIDSSLARLDARWRLAGLLATLLVAALVRTPAGATATLAGGLLLAVLARMDWHWFGGRLVIVGVLLVVFVVPMPFLASLDWREGFVLAGTIVLKALALLTLGAVLLVTAPLETTLKAARALKIPALLVHLTLLGYRYVFVLGDELARLRVALRVRGFRNRATMHGYRTVAAAAGTLLVRGHERADRVADAMRCRGFDGRFHSLAEFRTRVVDVVAMLLLLTGCAAIVGLDLFLRN